MSSPAPVAQAPAGGAAGAEAGEQPQQNQMQKVASLVLRMGVMYAFMMFMRSGKKEEGALDQQGPRVLIRPFFQQGQPLDMQLYLSTSSVIPDKLLWSEELVPLAGKDFSELHSVTLTRDDLSPALDRNESMYLITRFALPGSPATPIREAGVSFTSSIALTEFRPPPKDEEGHSLLSGSSDKDGTKDSDSSTKKPAKAEKPVEGSLDGEMGIAEAVAETEESEDEVVAEDGPWLPYLKPNMTISMVQMFETHNMKSLPPHMDQKLQVSQNSEQYYPLIHFNEFWTLKAQRLWKGGEDRSDP